MTIINENPASALTSNSKTAIKIPINNLRFRIYLSIQYHIVQINPKLIPVLSQKNIVCDFTILSTLPQISK